MAYLAYHSFSYAGAEEGRLLASAPAGEMCSRPRSCNVVLLMDLHILIQRISICIVQKNGTDEWFYMDIPFSISLFPILIVL